LALKKSRTACTSLVNLLFSLFINSMPHRQIC
jgi:hypothetical protein